MAIKIEFKGDGHKRMRKALVALQGSPAQRAYAMALNEVGKGAKAKTESTVAKQMGIKKSLVGKRGKISTRAAGAGQLAYVIKAEGGALSLKDFGPRQTTEGTRSDPWSRPLMFRRTFMGPRAGAVAISLGGHVFKRTGEFRTMTKGAHKGEKREVIKKLHGPRLPKEIVEGATKEVFETYTAERLPKRVAHQIKRATGGAFG